VIEQLGGHWASSQGQPTTVGSALPPTCEAKQLEKGAEPGSVLTQIRRAGVCMQGQKWWLFSSTTAPVPRSRWTIACSQLEYIMQAEAGHELFSELLTLGLAIKTVNVIFTV